jgi:hypothetical protein
MTVGGSECVNGACRCPGSDREYTLTEEQADSQCTMEVPCEGNAGGGDSSGGGDNGGSDNGGGELPDDFGGGDDFDF